MATRRRGTCRPAWRHSRAVRSARIGCPRRARTIQIFWVAVPRIRARELAHDRQGRRIALREPRLVAERRPNTAHARRLDRPRRCAYATRFLVLKEISDEPTLVLSERIIGSSGSGVQVSATRTIRGFAMVLQSMAFASLAIASP